MKHTLLSLVLISTISLQAGHHEKMMDAKDVVKKVRDATHHLTGLDIAVMGCIVNGPGEMADADYGYVGTGPGKISLYKKKEMIEKNIHSSESLEKLIQLIKDNGDWIDP